MKILLFIALTGFCKSLQPFHQIVYFCSDQGLYLGVFALLLVLFQEFGFQPTHFFIKLCICGFKCLTGPYKSLYSLFPNRSEQVISRRLRRLWQNNLLDRPLAQNIRNADSNRQMEIMAIDTVSAIQERYCTLTSSAKLIIRV